MRQETRARHSLGDGALGCGSLMDRAAGTATIFGTPNAQHPKACRHEVEHLADRLTDRVERTAAAGTDVLIDVLVHILAWQMAGKSLPPRCWLAASSARRCLRMMCLRSFNIGLKVFQTESQLIAIDPFRAAPELRALQPMNDEP